MHRSDTGQGLREFMNEIELLCQLHHPNLISLIGFCNHKDEKIIVYEYMSNGSLYDHLHNKDMEPLSWKKRLEICIGVARGVHYLHTGAKRTIIHCHISPKSILLDNNMVPKISEFGLSLKGQHFTSKPKPTPIPDDEFTTFAGTYSYTAPEVVFNMTITDKGDVYSFGIVLLEVVCTDNRLKMWQGHPIEDIIDLKIRGNIAPECWEVFMDITKRCLNDEPDERPTMGEVEVQLECALTLQEEADIKKTISDYTLLSTTTINSRLLEVEDVNFMSD
ncbi:Serine-threonine/tyrosine-protein kinase, catalytic domain [Sesbania bispinosa]|nr:Serine-threonine/tyrosine-protein kinase, catalytic domain [Sesbania bispinosa]